MVRKPVLMPPVLVGHVEQLAKRASKEEKRPVSFAEIVRRAVNDYRPDNTDGDEIIETVLDEIIASTRETINEVRRLNRKLDKSDKERLHGRGR